MHSTQAAGISLKADEVFEASPVGIVSCIVSHGARPAWWVVLEREGRSDTRWSFHRAIQREDGEIFFDAGHYDLTSKTAFELLAASASGNAGLGAHNAYHDAGRISFDHGEPGVAAKLPEGR